MLRYETIEARAKEIWNEREKRMPKFVQQTWDEGTYLARNATLELAEKELIANAIRAGEAE